MDTNIILLAFQMIFLIQLSFLLTPIQFPLKKIKSCNPTDDIFSTEFFETLYHYYQHSEHL